VPIFMNYSGYPAGAQGKPSHRQWIEISSFQWGIGRGITTSSGGASDREGSAPSVSEIVVTKVSDAASPNLFQHCLGATRLKVSFVFTNATAGPQHTLDLDDALITNIQPSGAGRSAKGEKVTVAFSGHNFNGIKNGPIPYALIHFPHV